MVRALEEEEEEEPSPITIFVNLRPLKAWIDWRSLYFVVGLSKKRDIR